MKLKEIFADIIWDWAHESTLFEMAWSRQRATDKLHGLSKPILEHLIKILKWDDKLNYKKHCNDLSSWFNELQSVELKNAKKINSRLSFECLITDNGFSLNNISRYIKNLRNYHQLPEIASDEEVYHKIIQIILAICVAIEKDTFEKIEDYF